MKTYLVEAYSDEIDFDKGSDIVALTPEVCYQLDKKGVKYSIIEDYYDSAELSKQVEEYRLSVFHWVDDFDAFLQKNIKGLELKLAKIYRWYLKGIVLDPLYLRCYTLQHLFEALQPTAITYIAYESDKCQINFRLENRGRSLYSQTIPIICHEKNIPLKTVLLKPDGGKRQQITSVEPYGNLIAKIKRELYKNNVVRRIYFLYRCLKKLTQFKQAGKNKLNIMLVRVSHIGEDFVAEALVRGHQVYLLSGNSILKYSYFGASKHLKLKIDSSLASEYNWQKAASLLADNTLIKWIAAKCQIDISEIVLERLKHFILVVCPQLVSYIKEFIEFYKNNNISLLFTPTVSYLEDYGALAAAKYYPRIKTACLVHGDAVYDSRVWNITELENYDIHISSNTETKEYFRRLAEEIHSNVKLYASPHRLSNVKKIASFRTGRGRNTIRKNRAIYLPMLMMWDERRNEGDPYSDTWIYRLQKSIIEYFATRDDYAFIWKGIPTSEEIYNPLPDFIKDNKFSNIEIATNPFIEHLSTVGRVICDCPSTGFYESVTAGVPTLSLCPDSMIVRKGAVSYFGNLLKMFSDIPEAIRHIDEFLNNDAELYKMTIDTEDNNVIDIIEGISEVEH